MNKGKKERKKEDKWIEREGGGWRENRETTGIREWQNRRLNNQAGNKRLWKKKRNKRNSKRNKK